MSEYQITSWKEIPSMITVRDGDKVVKSSLPMRFQEAIDELAMRQNESDSDSYMAGWKRSEWIKADGEPAIIAEQVVAGIEKDFSEAHLAALLDELGKPQN